MAFLEERLDTRITMNARFTDFMPGISRVRGMGGQLKVNYGATRSIVRADLQHGVHTVEQYHALVDVWYVITQTPYDGLRVRNPRDYKATQTNTAVRSLGGGQWQLQRRHTFGGVNIDVDIKKPLGESVIVYDAGGNALSASIDATTGIFTVVSGTPAKWVGLFDTPMTFSDDEWQAELLPGGAPGAMHVVAGEIRMESLLL